MTARTAAPSSEAVACLHAAIDDLVAIDADGLAPTEQAALLRSLGTAEARIAAVKLAVLGAAHRADAAASVGAASTDQWAAGSVNADPVVLHRQVELAQGLEHRTATRRALTNGELSAEHAAVIVHADRRLPRGVTAAQRDLVEEALVAKARTMPPALLRRVARRAWEAVEADQRLVDAHENALVLSEEDQARARTRLTLHDNNDGTVTGSFVLPRLHGDLLRKVLQTMTSPRRGRPGDSAAQVGDARRIWSDPDRARGAAFCELIEHLPTDHLHPRSAATLVVTVAEATLRESLAVAHLDTGAEISAGEARRLACTSGIIPAVLGSRSQPLDLGRAARLFSESQRVAVGLMHSTCAARGCDRPVAWCELHHHDAWARGGATDLANAIPLCHFHHRRIHDPVMAHDVTSEGIVFRQRA